MKKLRYLPYLLLVVVMLAACNRAENTPVPSTATSAPTATAATLATETPTSAPTVAPTETPLPTATLPPSPVETPTPAEAVNAAATVVATPCAQALSGNDAALVAQFPALGCPQGIPALIYMARQPFQSGHMIWREDTAMIYALNNDGSWLGVEDTFAEGDPESDPALTAPTGLFQPIRGFGKVWREQLGGANAAIGWSTAPEKGLDGSIQAWEKGVFLSFGLGEQYILLENGLWGKVE